jgi:pimeloyl-ACP methyl ester carboxylesterase
MLDRFRTTRGDVELSGLRSPATGDLVVLLHGLAGSAAEMAPVAEALGGDGHRVIALDQRGHGHSTRRPADLSREAFVADVLALLDEPPWIIGQSMGAHTAMLAAAEHPVKGLVMIEGTVGGDPDGSDYPTGLEKWFAGWPTPFKDERTAREFLGDTPIGRAWLADLEAGADGLRPRFDPDVMAAIMRPVAARPRWDAWARITAPTLVILGEHGTQNPGDVRRMAAETVTVAGAGHDVHLDEPEETLRLIRTFIGG